MKNLSVHQNTFLLTLLGAAGVVSGVVLERTEMVKDGHKAAPWVFLLGWLLVAYSVISSGRSGGLAIDAKSLIGLLSVAAILTSVYTYNSYSKDGKEMPAWLGFLFAAGWIGLALSASMKKGAVQPASAAYAMLGALFVTSSMLYFLPRVQRPEGIVDGPGMALFGAGWVLLALANASM